MNRREVSIRLTAEGPTAGRRGHRAATRRDRDHRGQHPRPRTRRRPCTRCTRSVKPPMSPPTRPGSPVPTRVSPGDTTQRFRDFARRSHEVIVLAAITGVVTGFAVAAFDRIVVDGLLDRLFELSPWVLAFMPLVGLALSWLALALIGGTRDSGMTDLYLKAFHDDDQQVPAARDAGPHARGDRHAGFGGAMGLEGGSLYLGLVVRLVPAAPVPALHRRQQPPGAPGRRRGGRRRRDVQGARHRARCSRSRCPTRKTSRAACSCRRSWRRRRATSRSSP